jgi:hypothetical protein
VVFGLSIDLPEHVVDENNEALTRGQWFVNLEGAAVETTYIEGQGTITTGIAISKETIVTTVSPDDGEMAMLSAKGISEDARLGERRQLQLTVGLHTVLVLRVSVSDSSPTVLASRLAEVFFGSSLSLVTQYRGCSFGAIQFEAYDSAHPVIDVVIQGNAASFTSDNLWPLAVNAAAALKNVKYLTDLAQHVAIVLPPGLSDSNDWYGTGYIQSGW